MEQTVGHLLISTTHKKRRKEKKGGEEKREEKSSDVYSALFVAKSRTEQLFIL